MNWGYSSRSIAIAAAIIVAVGLSQFGNAQTPPPSPSPAPSQTPPPSPSPSPSATTPQPKPSSSSCGEGGLPVCESETPPPFHSQFNGDKDATSSEATDFSNLMLLDDAEQAAVDAMAKAEKCGTEADITAARNAFYVANHAWHNAIYQYLDDWSNNVYPKKGGPPYTGPGAAQAATLYQADLDKFAAAIRKASKYVHEKTSDCPATPKKKAGILDDILGHVSIGVGVGGGSGHRGGDHPQGSDKPSTSTPPPSNETTSPSRD